METKAIRLYNILSEYAPSQKERDVVTRFYQGVLRTHAASKIEIYSREVEIALTSAIYDGLVYGNWPWVTVISK
jgi:hypothetical protein